ncbi:MAG TPA: FKBP-type peptidyl-prolyl cis-trans isomerase [Steroidobacteraceae bacterium]|nr:FKBP-type peptidyl-prolyl cis-trans isomerase [Steroidobacteraceae bacterium]
MSIFSISKGALVALSVCAAALAFADPPATSAAAAPAATSASAPAAPAATPRQAAEAEGLKITDLKVGKGPAAMPGAVVRVHYTGWLLDATAADGKGAKFDSSVDRHEPFLFQLGQQRVIRGWDLGVAGMQAGGKRRLVIPPALGYGARGASTVIPPNATLVFDVELIDFLPPL